MGRSAVPYRTVRCSVHIGDGVPYGAAHGLYSAVRLYLSPGPAGRSLCLSLTSAVKVKQPYGLRLYTAYGGRGRRGRRGRRARSLAQSGL
eukprot:5750350-Prymnesium_polylepis.1